MWNETCTHSFNLCYNEQVLINLKALVCFIFLLQHVHNSRCLALYTWEENKINIKQVVFSVNMANMKVMFSCYTLFFAGWCCRICRSLGISQLHPLDVRPADDFMLYDRMRVVFTHNASCCLLDTVWSFPGFIDILGWELLQKRKVLSLKAE